MELFTLDTSRNQSVRAQSVTRSASADDDRGCNCALSAWNWLGVIPVALVINLPDQGGRRRKQGLAICPQLLLKLLIIARRR